MQRRYLQSSTYLQKISFIFFQQKLAHNQQRAVGMEEVQENKDNNQQLSIMMQIPK